MNKPKLSIIVPAYNAEQYLECCFNSVLKQEYQNYEMIVVDDGSRDRTGEICDQFEKHDPRIKVIHQPNMGRSGARNSAIKIAKGDYIGFLDADDFYTDDALVKIAKCIEENNFPDVFFGRFTSFSEDTDFRAEDSVFDAERINGKSSDEVIRYLLSIPFMYTQCRYYVKKDLLLKEELRFTDHLAHEDEAWTPVLLSTASSFCALEDPFYVYRVHSNSFMTTVDIKKQVDKLWIAIQFCNRQKKLDSSDIRFSLFEDRIQKLTLSAVSESYCYGLKEMGQIGKMCELLYRRHPGAFHKMKILEKLAGLIGWVNALRVYLMRIQLAGKVNWKRRQNK